LFFKSGSRNQLTRYKFQSYSKSKKAFNRTRDGAVW
jgi:hypothetical protein